MTVRGRRALLILALLSCLDLPRCSDPRNTMDGECRVTSPDGRFDAVLSDHDSHGGAASFYWWRLSLCARGRGIHEPHYYIDIASRDLDIPGLEGCLTWPSDEEIVVHTWEGMPISDRLPKNLGSIKISYVADN